MDSLETRHPMVAIIFFIYLRRTIRERCCERMLLLVRARSCRLQDLVIHRPLWQASTLPYLGIGTTNSIISRVLGLEPDGRCLDRYTTDFSDG